MGCRRTPGKLGDSSTGAVASRLDADHDAVCASCVGGAKHLVVVAPPGTGKTHLSVRLAATLAPSLAKHERILLVTFSNQARAQLESSARRQHLPPEARQRIEITNYHGFFHKAVWANRRALNLPLSAQLGTSRRRLSALHQAGAAAIAALKADKGLGDVLAEHKFECFRDTRTPASPLLGALLDCIAKERVAGRLVFDDLGALFWEILERYPTIAQAYKRRYPVVIADEHQDASALQDAVVRRLASRCLIVFADPMQLIYGFRGSKPERLERHIREAGTPHELRTPHRWAGEQTVGDWLLAVRARLSGERRVAVTPRAVQVIRSQYVSEMKSLARFRALKAAVARKSVAIIVRDNEGLGDLRRYLSKNGVFVRQLGSGNDFEEAHSDMEQLPLLRDWVSLAHSAIERIAALVPAIDDHMVKSAKTRVKRNKVQTDNRCGSEVAAILKSIDVLRTHGAGHYFQAIVAALGSLKAMGFNLPRIEAVRALKETADRLAGGSINLDSALSVYSARVAAQAHRSYQVDAGIYVMTAHQAKGKEFDTVIMFDASNRWYPDDEEHRRLFYVGLTRATRSWALIAPEKGASPLLRHL